MNNNSLDPSIILDFINRRFPDKLGVSNTADYYIAKAIADRFQEMQIYWQPSVNKCFAGADNDTMLYDVWGAHNIADLVPVPILLSDLKVLDPENYTRVVEDKIH